jgi:LPLT family lysophospholipid transporter-like MFS transporter
VLLVVTLVAVGLVGKVPLLRASHVAGGLAWFPWVMALRVAAGVAAGLFLIPLNAALQAETDPTRMGKTIAVQNLCDNVGMLLAGGLVAVCVHAGEWFGTPVSAGGFFLVLAALVGLALMALRIPARTAS